MEEILAQTKKFEEFGGVAPKEKASGFEDVATLKGLEAVFFNIVVVALAIAGIALFVMLIIGGFKYLTAGASQEQAQSARQTLTYAFIGFVIIVAAFLILRFVSEFTGVKSILEFKITQ